MNIKINGLVNDSIVDGTGLRMTIFTQGCFHHCPHCHNPQTHDPEGGTMWQTEDIIAAFRENPLLDGITLSGGEPFEQSEACTELAKAAHQSGLNVWTYTGYTWEVLLEKNDPSQMELLRNTDVLVDGPFLKEQLSLELKFKGSKNQRVIDVVKSLNSKKIIFFL